MKFQKNILLKNYTTFKIGGAAKYFYTAKTKEDLIKIIKMARKFKLPFFILGGGSNLLVADEGYKGLVIKIKNQKLKIKNNKISVEAGVPLSQLVNVALKNNLANLEWAAGIPGTVGGAIYGAAGTFERYPPTSRSMEDVIREVEVYDTKNQKIKILKNKDCKFGYRDSIFKQKPNLIILSAVLQLRKSSRKEIQKKIKEYLNYRKKTQPLNFPSAGSIFQNPKSKIQNPKLLKKFPELREFNKNNLIPVGYLIEKCSLKGKKIGKVKISEKHANFILNLGQGKAKDVIKLIKLIKKRVKNKFKVNLEEEIQFLVLHT